MKVLQLIQKPQLRGAEMFASQLSNQLLQASHEVHLVSLLEGDASLPFKGNHIRLNRSLNKRFVDVPGWKAFAQHIKKIKPDVVQANAGDTLKFAVFSKLFFGWKTPIIFRNANKVSDFINTAPKLWFNKFLMSRVTHTISVSELCRQDFINTYSFKNNKTTTVPIGINLQPFDKTLPTDLVSFFSSGKVLVNVASFVPEKNHSGLLKIIEELVAQGEDVKLVLVGDGKLRSAIEQQINELNLSDHIFLAGYRKDVLSIIANAHAFVLPSVIEGLPGVILEAMWCKTPVIAYDVGGISEVVINKETGWLVKAGDEDGFVRAVKEVLHMKREDLDVIKERAFNKVVNEFDNKVIAKRFLEVYKRVVSRESLGDRHFEEVTQLKN